MGELIRVTNATVSRPGAGLVLCDLTWRLRDGETWAIVGPTASGKTTFAELLAGKLRLDAGTIEWPLIDRSQVAWPSDVIELVAFRAESRLFSPARHFYQERFNFSDPLDDPTLDQFLQAGTKAGEAAVRSVAKELEIESLRQLSLIKLSNGQLRRARIARALLTEPELLILDDPFLGLDANGRSEVAHLLGEIVNHGRRVLLIARREELPEWVTDVLELSVYHPSPPGLAGGEGRVRGDSAPALTSRTTARSAPARAPTAALPLTRFERLAAHPPHPYPSPPAKPGGEGKNGEALVELHHVTVSYGRRRILDDVSWTVRRGERWAVLGPNGSGKSTLLSLLCGDHPQAYSNDVRLFGRRRGSGESIWDIKRRIGLVSPELHLYFHEPLTAAQTAATGFFDVVTLRLTTPEQDKGVRELFTQFGIGKLAERPFAQLSTGEQRLVLFIRAFVKRPELLILDEPFQGMDAELAATLRDWLDANLDDEQTLLFVTHVPEEIPRTVTHQIMLNSGRGSL